MHEKKKLVKSPPMPLLQILYKPLRKNVQINISLTSKDKSLKVLELLTLKWRKCESLLRVLEYF